MHEPEIFLHTCVFFCALLLKRSFGGKDMMRSFRTSKTDGSEESAVSDDFIASVRKNHIRFTGYGYRVFSGTECSGSDCFPQPCPAQAILCMHKGFRT